MGVYTSRQYGLRKRWSIGQLTHPPFHPRLIIPPILGPAPIGPWGVPPPKPIRFRNLCLADCSISVGAGGYA